MALTRLSTEIWNNIIQHLLLMDYIRLRKTCRFFASFPAIPVLLFHSFEQSTYQHPQLARNRMRLHLSHLTDDMVLFLVHWNHDQEFMRAVTTFSTLISQHGRERAFEAVVHSNANRLMLYNLLTSYRNQRFWEQCNVCADPNNNIKPIDPFFTHLKAVWWTAERGDVPLVDLLLSIPPGDKLVNYALQQAVEHNQIQLVQWLLDHTEADPAFQDNISIVRAAKKGYSEIVNILLADERVNPGAQENAAFEHATVQGHIDIISRLLQDPRVDNWSLQFMKEHFE
ncbi:hypothetical protein EDD86DRAFT_199375 [Gorgonomyces haynaldii]|nr:hypothetical protein EDD86DRAFT_199375 [Gorgonomyces haynaldii]